MTHRTENTPSDNTFQPGVRVRLADRLVPHYDGETHGTVDQHPVGGRYVDVLVNVDGRVHWFAATDLTLDPLPEPAQRAAETATQLDTYTCPHPGCDFDVHATGPVDIDDEDPFQLEVDVHRRSHEPDPRDAPRGIVGEASALVIYHAVRDIPGIYDALAKLCDLPAKDVALALRAVAAELEDPSR